MWPSAWVLSGKQAPEVLLRDWAQVSVGPSPGGKGVISGTILEVLQLEN